MSIPSKINPDIKEERDKVSFDVEEFTNWYYGGAEKVKEKRFLGNRFNGLSLTFKLHKPFFNQRTTSYRITSCDLELTLVILAIKRNMKKEFVELQLF
jgi:hypothetical protein